MTIPGAGFGDGSTQREVGGGATARAASASYLEGPPAPAVGQLNDMCSTARLDATPHIVLDRLCSYARHLPLMLHHGRMFHPLIIFPATAFNHPVHPNCAPSHPHHISSAHVPNDLNTSASASASTAIRTGATHRCSPSDAHVPLRRSLSALGTTSAGPTPARTKTRSACTSLQRPTRDAQQTAAVYVCMTSTFDTPHDSGSASSMPVSRF